MRIYRADSEETLRARKLLKDWTGEGFLTKEQHEKIQQETVFDLRTTNIFLRIVLFLFTVIGVAAAAGLLFTLFVPHSNDKPLGVFLLIWAAVSYTAAEISVAQARLYRYGIEEALASSSIAFLCGGMLVFFDSSETRSLEWIVLLAGAALSLWVWHRFGLWYAFLAAMILAAFLPDAWTSDASAKHVLLALVYTAGLVVIVAVRTRHRFDFLDGEYSLVEALLWLGIYFAINLKVAALDPRPHWMGVGISQYGEISKPFYWTTWLLTWALPPVILTRAIRRKDRFVLAVGAILAVVTLATNKPYLGWQRNTWDPMLLGVLLISVALFLRRWLAAMPGGVRRGFTAARLSGKDKQWMNVASPALGLVSGQAVTPHGQAQSAGVQFGGGSSGGGGASGEF